MKRFPGPYPTIAALSAMVRADDNAAVNHVLNAVIAADGRITIAAAAMGVSPRVLYAWRDANKRLEKGFARYALGREGAGKNATAARLKKPSRRRKSAS